MGTEVDSVDRVGEWVRSDALRFPWRTGYAGQPIRLATLSALGTPEAGKEALAFAFLAHQTLAGLPGNVPGATGAARAVVLGHITPGGAA